MMRKRTVYRILATIAMLLMLFAPCRSAAQETKEPANDAVLIMPVHVASFEKKDKFYGSREQLERSLQQFFTFTSTVLTAKQIIRPDLESLWKKYPLEKVYANGGAATLSEKVSLDALREAAGEYGARYVVCIENTKAAVLVKDAKWTINAEIRYVIYDAATGVISDDKSYSREEGYVYYSKNDAKNAGGGKLVTFSGRTVDASELAQDPMIFGGTVGGFPFVSLARNIANDISEL